MECLDSFNPATTSIIDKRFDNYISQFKLDPTSSIRLIQEKYKPNHLVYETKNINSDQLAVFSEIYYDKGWNAYIDGKKAPYFRSNYVLRAMMIPSGTEKVEFKFEPETYQIGERVSLTSSVILLLLLGFVSFKELRS